MRVTLESTSVTRSYQAYPLYQTEREGYNYVCYMDIPADHYFCSVHYFGHASVSIGQIDIFSHSTGYPRK